MLILADGHPLPRKQLLRLKKGAFVLALDGAAERCHKEKWLPDLILGDLDALSPGSLKFFQKMKVPILIAPDQNFSDLEKGIVWAIENKFSEIQIAQAWGDRVDHSLYTFHCLKKYFHKNLNVHCLTKTSKITFIRNQKWASSGKIHRAFAILPFSKCKVWSKGLEYEMQGLRLDLGNKASTSNQAMAKKIELRIKGDALLVEEL